MTTIQNQPVSSSLLQEMSSAKTKASGSQEAQDRFMTLLISQMKNQDPLNPMDNAQMTSQLAQLSTVTGIDKLNTTMESLISNMQSSQTYQASSMIGHTVLVPGNTFSLANSQGTFAIELPSKADAVSVTIKDSAGRTVKDMTLGGQAAGTLPVGWNGYNDAGNLAADGVYKIEVTATAAGIAIEVNTLSYAGVNSISNGTSGIKLHLDNNTVVSTSDVQEIL